MTIGTFSTINTKKLKTKKDKKHRAVVNPNARYKCSSPTCTVKNDVEDVLIVHIMSENDCKANYYLDRG